MTPEALQLHRAAQLFRLHGFTHTAQAIEALCVAEIQRTKTP